MDFVENLIINLVIQNDLLWNFVLWQILVFQHESLCILRCCIFKWRAFSNLSTFVFSTWNQGFWNSDCEMNFSIGGLHAKIYLLLDNDYVFVDIYYWLCSDNIVLTLPWRRHCRNNSKYLSLHKILLFKLLKREGVISATFCIF